MKTGNENLATYVIKGTKYYVYGCYDNTTPDGEYSFYDIESEYGNCLTLGDPFHHLPTYTEVKEIVGDIL